MYGFAMSAGSVREDERKMKHLGEIRRDLLRIKRERDGSHDDAQGRFESSSSGCNEEVLGADDEVGKFGAWKRNKNR